MYGCGVGSFRRLVALPTVLSVVALTSIAGAITYSGANVVVPAGASGNPNIVVNATGTATFAGGANADFLIVSANGAITGSAGEISAVQGFFLTTGSNVTLSSALNSIDRATIDTSNGTTAVGDIVLNQQQSIILDTLRGRSVRVTTSRGDLVVTTRVVASGGLALQTRAGSVSVAGTTTLGPSSSFSATGPVGVGGVLTVPSLRNGYALELGGSSVAVDVDLNLGALGFVPAAETRIHVFSFARGDRVVRATPSTLPVLPARMTWDFSEIGTTGDAIIRVCGDGIQGATEACDDGNVLDGDGCSSTCAVEPPVPDGGAPDAGPDAGPEVDGGDDAGDDAGADASVLPDAAVDGGYGGSGGKGPSPIGEPEGIAADIDIEGGACSFGAAAPLGTWSGAGVPAVLLGLVALARRRRRAT